jgi:hypothetical protein
MLRRIRFGLMVIVCALSMGASAWAATSGPYLGYRHAYINGAGFGTVHPRRVFFGGDPTSNISKIVWSKWGTRTATGLGTGWCPGKRGVADGHPCSVRLRVWNLGACHGHEAYRTIELRYETRRGRWSGGDPGNVCPAHTL